MAPHPPLHAARGAACVALLVSWLLAAACEGEAPEAVLAPASPTCNPECAPDELCVELGPGRTACVHPDALACPDTGCDPAPPPPSCAPACGADEVCEGGLCAPAGLGCADLDACVAACAPRGPGCALVCRQQATGSALERYDALLACGLQAGCDDWPCVAGACPEALKACLGEAP